MSEPTNWLKTYALAKKVLIWGVFFAILYLLRDLFGLVFFTFILAFILFRFSEVAVRRLGIARRLAIVAIYVVLVIAIVGAGHYVVTRMFDEARQFAADLPTLKTKLTDQVNMMRARHIELAPVIDAYAGPGKVEATIARLLQGIEQGIPRFVQGVIHLLMTVILSILFSFLIVLDLARLRRDVKRLINTRLHDFFQETARPIVTFAGIVGRAFEAQTFIAIINTLLTLLGMYVLEIPKVALLSIIVFLCSFVPVLGVFISSVPIVLVAFNTGGVWLLLSASIMIFLVHTVEAYIINPRIYAHHMKMNPVFVLIVLFLGHHLFGVWGVLLAVPVTQYFLLHVAGLALLDKPRRAADSGTQDNPTQTGIDAEKGVSSAGTSPKATGD